MGSSGRTTVTKPVNNSLLTIPNIARLLRPTSFLVHLSKRVQDTMAVLSRTQQNKMYNQTFADFLAFFSALEQFSRAQHNPLTPHDSIMASATSPQLALLRAKLALAIGPVDLNLAYHEVKANRPDALNEPWSTDMSGPHKLVGELALLARDLENWKLTTYE